ncbi:hypothetical protein D3C81_1036770 [compost metagenome]
MNANLLRKPQHLLPNRCQLRFQLIARCDVLRSASRFPFRHRQRLPVNLSVRRQRQALQLHKVRRNHVARQFAGNHPLQIRRRQAFFRCIISAQSFLTFLIFPDDDDRFLHATYTQQLRFDFARLNPVAPDFRLVVDPADEVHVSVLHPPRQISRAVQSLARGERAVYELLFRQLRTVQVPARHSDSADNQLAQHPDRHRIQMRVHDVEFRIQPRFADRHIACLRQLRQLLVVEA